MMIEENQAIAKKYWFTWGITTGLGIFILLIQLDSYNNRSLCSPVVGCGYEGPLLLTILISFFLLITRIFRKNKSKLITPLILLVFSFLILIFTFSSEKRFNESMTSLAKNIQELCITNEECPVTLSTAFDDVRLVKAGTIYTLEGVEDEIIENASNIIAAGYIRSSSYRYKLKPYYGFMHFDYRATGRKFKLEWVSGEAKVIRARVTNYESPKLLLENYCDPSGETCYENEIGTSYL
jgi:energy-coupling factor transporter transmembrane protein EcfT